jgi:2-oxoglutarate ferredoxin oxidoreductase subunit alpha
MPSPSPSTSAGYRTPLESRPRVALRFAGDSGDGMMLAGTRFAAAAAQAGNDVQSLPLPPSEIRAPAGTIAAVSAYQIHFGDKPLTAGDRVDALVAMNPAALKLHLPDVAAGGLVIVNTDSFDAAELEKAGYTSNPLTNCTLSSYRVVSAPIHRLNREAVAPVKLLSPREADRSRNLFALGLACWFFDRPLEPTLDWIRDKFVKNPLVVDANTRALQAGFDYGRTLGDAPNCATVPWTVPAAPRCPGKYRRVSGHEALSLGLAAAAYQLKRPLVFAAYPMAPASELQQQLFDLRACGVQAVEAEDEMAAAGMALGAAFAGAVGVTITSGPGLCLMGETIGLAVVSELPLVVVDVMRAGPGNGIPNASDQGDLLQAVFGRNGDSPVVVLAPTSPADGFATALRAVRVAVQAMTPVIILTDIHLGLGAEAWKVPSLGELPPLQPPKSEDVRPWVVPGTPGGEHRQSGLEKADGIGPVTDDPLNHERMLARRGAKIDRLADELPLAEVIGSSRGDVVIVGWGSAAGAIRAAVLECQVRGWKVAGAIVPSLNPLPRNLEGVLKSYRRVLVAELNAGQLAIILRARFALDAATCNNNQARPFEVADLVRAVEAAIER